MTEHIIRDREEVSDQIKALNELKEMAKIYGFDISNPATNAKEAVQWLYFGYLAAIKQQNGAAMSIGNIATFLDIFIERDMQAGLLTETEAQELIDNLVLKLRMVKFARTPDYNQLFSGDPIWATLIVGEMLDDEKSLVTKTDFRFIHTLDNMGNSPEPNITVLWSPKLPKGFKEYCANSSINHSAIQYESEDLLADFLESKDKSIACCVSGMRTGKDMQFFGARANLPKALLYTINGGRDEITGAQVGPKTEPLRGVLNYDEVMKEFDGFMEWLCKVYVNTLNVIHYMHDKYSYESLEMALHDTDVRRFMATGIAGLSVIADSLSAIKYAKVTPIVDEETGLAVDFKVEGEFPTFGNDDDRVDDIAVYVMKEFMKKLKKHPLYRADEITTSILTITSNVVVRIEKNIEITPEKVKEYYQTHTRKETAQFFNLSENELRKYLKKHNLQRKSPGFNGDPTTTKNRLKSLKDNFWGNKERTQAAKVKAQKTMEERYQDKNYNVTQCFKTIEKKYGEKTYMDTKCFYEKSSKTWENKYNKQYPSLSEDSIKKAENTNISLYGARNILCRDSWLRNEIWDKWNKSKNGIFSKEELSLKPILEELSFKHNNKEFFAVFSNGRRKYPDYYSLDKKIVLEYNGSYYHKDKTEILYWKSEWDKLGYKLLVIWDYERKDFLSKKWSLDTILNTFQVK